MKHVRERVQPHRSARENHRMVPPALDVPLNLQHVIGDDLFVHTVPARVVSHRSSLPLSPPRVVPTEARTVAAPRIKAHRAPASPRLAPAPSRTRALRPRISAAVVPSSSLATASSARVPVPVPVPVSLPRRFVRRAFVAFVAFVARVARSPRRSRTHVHVARPARVHHRRRSPSRAPRCHRAASSRASGPGPTP